MDGGSGPAASCDAPAAACGTRLSRRERIGVSDGKASSVLVRSATLTDLDQLAPLFDAYRQFYAQAADLPKAQTYLAERFERRDAELLLALAPDGGHWGSPNCIPRCARSMWPPTVCCMTSMSARKHVARVWRALCCRRRVTLLWLSSGRGWNSAPPTTIMRRNAFTNRWVGSKTGCFAATSLT